MLFTHAARSFSTTEARQQDLLRYALDGYGYTFSCAVIISIPGVCRVFELGMNRANEVQLLCAPPAFEVFFPGRVGFRFLKSSEQHGQISTAEVLRLRAT
jgi:hypothetical protein